MSNLLSFAKQQAIKPISGNNESRHPILATEAENRYLRDVIGAAFLLAITKAPTSYTALLDGSEFENCHGQTLKQQGLRYVLAYFVYAMYVPTSDAQDTFSGFVRQARQEAAPISDGAKREIIQSAVSIATRELEIISEFLQANSSDPLYALWCGNNTTQIPKSQYYKSLSNRRRNGR